MWIKIYSFSTGNWPTPLAYIAIFRVECLGQVKMSACALVSYKYSPNSKRRDVQEFLPTSVTQQIKYLKTLLLWLLDAQWWNIYSYITFTFTFTFTVTFTVTVLCIRSPEFRLRGLIFPSKWMFELRVVLQWCFWL